MLYLLTASSLLFFGVFGQGNSEPTAEPVPCDDSDVNAYTVDYVGKSTQFRIFNPCDGSNVKIKMEGLTELTADGTKTGNKEVTFASTKGWEWGLNSGEVVEYNGVNATFNQYVADQLMKTGAKFSLTTYFFKEEVTIGNDTYLRNSLKFGVEIGNWNYLAADNTIEFCVDILAKGQSKEEGENGTKFVGDEYYIDNENTASCKQGNETNEISVKVTEQTNGNNQLTLCYDFERCDGDIVYDPVVHLFGAASTLRIGVALVFAFVCTLFV